MTVPARPADITADVFNELTGRTDVIDVTVVGEDHGTAIRARLDVTSSSVGPLRVFVKMTPTRPAERLLNRALQLGHNEVELFRHLAADLDDVMPKFYGAASDSRRGRSVVVMEDLTGRGARFGDVVAGCTSDEAAAIVRTLAVLHRRFWDSNRFAGDLAPFAPPASRALKWGPQSWRMVNLLPRRYHDVVPQKVRDDARILGTKYRVINAAMRRGPMTLLHSDTHLGNMCFVANDPVLYDWQTASQGPGIKDLAYFMATSLHPDTRRAIERDLLTEYLETLAASSGPRLTWSQAWDDYRFLAHTAYTAAAVTSAFSGKLQGEATTRVGLDRAAQAVQDLDSFTEVRARIA